MLIVWSENCAAPSHATTITTVASPAKPTANRSSSRWRSPTGVKFDLVQRFRAPPHPYAAGHRGIDLKSPGRGVIVAPTSGVVSFVGVVADRGVLSIRVDHATVVSLEPVLARTINGVTLQTGDFVSRGVAVATMSSGGHCGERCVHLGVRVNDEYVNPMRFFAGKPRLLPW